MVSYEVIESIVRHVVNNLEGRPEGDEEEST